MSAIALYAKATEGCDVRVANACDVRELGAAQGLMRDPQARAADRSDTRITR